MEFCQSWKVGTLHVSRTGDVGHSGMTRTEGATMTQGSEVWPGVQMWPRSLGQPKHKVWLGLKVWPVMQVAACNAANGQSMLVVVSYTGCTFNLGCTLNLGHTMDVGWVSPPFLEQLSMTKCNEHDYMTSHDYCFKVSPPPVHPKSSNESEQ